MPEFRPLPDERWDAFVEYTAYAFTPERGPVTYDPDEHDDRSRLGDRRGLYDDGAPTDADPLCVCRHHWLEARVRGETHSAPGLAAVASPPEHRRQGHVGRLLEGCLGEYRERGDRFSLLWPFRYRFYRQFGWDTCGRRVVIECPPDALAFAAGRLETAGEYVSVTPDEHDRLEPVYEAHLGRYGCAIERTESWWRERVFRSWTDDRHASVWRREDEPAGYLLYEIAERDGDRIMHVTELGYVDHEAYHALLAFCHRHDSQVSTVRLWEPATSSTPEQAPADAPAAVPGSERSGASSPALLDLVSDPEEVSCTLETGPMVRVVDVASTLSALAYPAVDAGVVLCVEDPLVEWNDGPFDLAVADGVGRCEPTTGAPDCRLDVGALSQLAVGYRSATALVRADRLEVTGDGALESLEALFPRKPTYLGEKF